MSYIQKQRQTKTHSSINIPYLCIDPDAISNEYLIQCAQGGLRGEGGVAETPEDH